MKLHLKLWVVGCLILATTSQLHAQLQVSKLFSDHMVIQRNQEIRIWGWHKKGTKVSVTFNGSTKQVKTNRKGEWMITLPEMTAGGPYVLSVVSGQEQQEFNDIMLGDVWVCSGQSNMEWVVENSNNALAEIANASDSRIRHFKVPNSYANSPELTLAGGEWQVASPETMANFTAVGYYFAKHLRTDNDVTIGLLNTSWGGSRIEPWMSAESLQIKDTEAYIAEAQKEHKAAFMALENKLKATFPKVGTTDQGTVNGEPVWAATDLDETGWIPMAPTQLWEAQGFEGLDGVGWYRKTITLSETEAQHAATLSLAMVDDSDEVWVNENKVGETIQQYEAKRVYNVEPQFLKPGANVIVVKVDDTGGGGGIYGDAKDLFLKTSSQKIDLSQPWAFNIGAYREPYMGVNQIGTLLYNKMIVPIQKFPITGVIWYQGESNANSEADATAYAELFQTMITQWRTEWEQGDFPFLWVQLANFMKAQPEPIASNWAVLRESQSKALSLPNTAQAVIIDIGDAEDIHPRNKQDVGYRLALGAEVLQYGKQLEYSGPVFKQANVVGNTLELSFTHVGNGLKTKDKYGYVKGFAIAGDDKQFVWAKAKIEGDKVIVWNKDVKQPKYVRYAWADNPDDASLYNTEDLPASPFSNE
ncbi:sialate O-acetylesterase [Formosa sp. A9]|uniref:sialate O-acetylesterase n=1 Tax=Formosa sp. A9 TaxID=3442641 RepID=UPI003EBCB35D